MQEIIDAIRKQYEQEKDFYVKKHLKEAIYFTLLAKWRKEL